MNGWVFYTRYYYFFLDCLMLWNVQLRETYLLLSWKPTPKRPWDEVNFQEFHSLTSCHEILSWKGAFAPSFKYLGHQWLRVWEAATRTSAANWLFCESFVREFGFSGRARTVVSIITFLYIKIHVRGIWRFTGYQSWDYKRQRKSKSGLCSVASS